MQLITAPKPVVAPRAKRMLISEAKRGKLKKPPRILFYGVDKIGKSTFASESPNPIFVGVEDGTAQLDIARFSVEPQGWQDMIDAIEQARTEPHDYKTLTIDTLDWLEPLCMQSILDETGKRSFEDFAWGAGTTHLLKKWRDLLHKLDELRDARDMNIILLAHAQVKLFKNPEGDDFDRYELKLNKVTSALVREWADAILFANYEVLAYSDKNKRVRGVDSGARFIHTQRHAAFDAGNRYGLPDRLPLDWSEFYSAMQAGETAPTEALKSNIRELAAGLDATTAAKVEAAVAAAGDDSIKLSKIADKLRAKIDTTGESK